VHSLVLSLSKDEPLQLWFDQLTTRGRHTVVRLAPCTDLPRAGGGLTKYD
jgi:hypothetical protein